MRALFGDEPPTFHAADRLAYNAAMNALDRPAIYKVKVTGIQRALRNWRRYEGVHFPRYEEIAAERAKRRAAVRRWLTFWRRK